MLSFISPVVTPADADAYCAARGYVDWTGDETAKAAAILRGQLFIAATYNARWAEVWESVYAPEAVRFAVIEAARRELAEIGTLAPDFDPTLAVKSRSEGVGPMSESVTYATPDSAARAAKTFPIIEALLAPHLAGMGGNNFSVSRG